MRGPASRPHGLTLLELAVALAITAVLVTLAAPSMLDGLARHRLRAVAQDLATDLGEARQESARLGRPLHVVFATGRAWCYAVATRADADCRRPDAAALKVVRGSDHPGVTLVDAATQSFDGSIGASLGAAGHGRFESSRGRQILVRLSGVGRPSLCAPAGALPDIASC
jgi:prepilin-type N-terminal cleavage/methylation domain-containing protein